MHCSILKINFHFFTFNMSATIHCFPFMCNYFNLNSCTKYLDYGKAPGHFPGQNLFFFLCFFYFLGTSKSVQFQTPCGPLLLGCTWIPLYPSGCLNWDSMRGNFLSNSHTQAECEMGVWVLPGQHCSFCSS